MEDERVWHHEKLLWTGSHEEFNHAIEAHSLVVGPMPPFVMEGQEIIQTVAKGPRFADVTMAHRRIARPQEGLIVVAYKAIAPGHGEDDYNAWCTTTWRRIAHDEWRVVQHQQTPTAEGPFRSG
ncbi:MAG: DUF4440 domain-containing protein [Sphingobium sp.]|nr:DUF4440 domain-containing protein [Sphingobium sp.]